MKLFTIGFTATSAENFFNRLAEAGVKRVIDVRLNNQSQLAGFTRRDDLRYFLNAILGIDYEHRLELAPEKEMLDEYRKSRGKSKKGKGAQAYEEAWRRYEERFLELITRRRIEEKVDRSTIDQACLLCSEASAEYCHRRLVAEYLQKHWGDLEVGQL